MSGYIPQLDWRRCQLGVAVSTSGTPRNSATDARPSRAHVDGRLGRINITRHNIEFVEGPRGREHEPRQVKKMLKDGVISPSKSQWASPVVPAPKSDGSLQFFVDYRKLKSATLRDSYSIFRMDECIDTLGGAKVFTTLDANWEFLASANRRNRPRQTRFCATRWIIQI